MGLRGEVAREGDSGLGDEVAHGRSHANAAVLGLRSAHPLKLLRAVGAHVRQAQWVPDLATGLGASAREVFDGGHRDAGAGRPHDGGAREGERGGGNEQRLAGGGKDAG